MLDGGLSRSISGVFCVFRGTSSESSGGFFVYWQGLDAFSGVRGGGFKDGIYRAFNKKTQICDEFVDKR